MLTLSNDSHRNGRTISGNSVVKINCLSRTIEHYQRSDPSSHLLHNLMTKPFITATHCGREKKIIGCFSIFKLITRLVASAIIFSNHIVRILRKISLDAMSHATRLITGNFKHRSFMKKRLHLTFLKQHFLHVFWRFEGIESELC